MTRECMRRKFTKTDRLDGWPPGQREPASVPAPVNTSDSGSVLRVRGVVVGVVLAGFVGVVRGVVVMAVRDVRVVTGRFMPAPFMMLSGGAMVLGRQFQMLRGFPMVFNGLLGHVRLLLCLGPFVNSKIDSGSMLNHGYDAGVTSRLRRRLAGANKPHPCFSCCSMSHTAKEPQLALETQGHPR